MSRPRPSAHRVPVAGLGLAAGALLALGACGSTSHSGASATNSSTAPAATSGGPSASGSAGPSSPAASVTIQAADVPGYGAVLVDGSGRTLYMLTSERGGRITCTDENGCTKAWPATELPDGMTAATAGRGATASLLGTVKDAKGSLYVTYGGWPLYTFAGDQKAGQANGEGITSFGGTWYVLGASGHPITSSSSSSSSGPGGY